MNEKFDSYKYEAAADKLELDNERVEAIEKTIKDANPIVRYTVLALDGVFGARKAALAHYEKSLEDMKTQEVLRNKLLEEVGPEYKEYALAQENLARDLGLTPAVSDAMTYRGDWRRNSQIQGGHFQAFEMDTWDPQKRVNAIALLDALKPRVKKATMTMSWKLPGGKRVQDQVMPTQQRVPKLDSALPLSDALQLAQDKNVAYLLEITERTERVTRGDIVKLEAVLGNRKLYIPISQPTVDLLRQVGPHLLDDDISLYGIDDNGLAKGGGMPKYKFFYHYNVVTIGEAKKGEQERTS